MVDRSKIVVDIRSVLINEKKLTLEMGAIGVSDQIFHMECKLDDMTDEKIGRVLSSISKYINESQVINPKKMLIDAGLTNCTQD